MYNNPIGYKSCLRLQHQFWLWTVNPKTNLFTLSCRQKLLTESTLNLLVKQMSYKLLSSNYNRLQVLACNRSKCKGISSKPVSCHVHLETFPLLIIPYWRLVPSFQSENELPTVCFVLLTTMSIFSACYTTLDK